MTSIFFVGTLSLAFIFKKSLEELKSVSYAFLVIVMLFVALLLVELIRDDQKNIEPWAVLASPKKDYQLLTAYSIMIFSYTMQFMVFPAYSELDHRSPARFAWASFWSLVIYSFALIVTGVTCSLLFGKEIKPDLL